MMKSIATPLALILSILIGTFATAGQQPASKPLPAELTDTKYISEVVRHLYRWYLDEKDVRGIIDKNRLTVWVRQDFPKLDEGDRSQYAQLLFPQLDVCVSVKRANYDFPELNTTVTNDTFKIINVAKTEFRDTPPEDATKIIITYSDIRDYLARTRNELLFPKDELLKQMGQAVLKELKSELDTVRSNKTKDSEIVHLASLSPVANEAWVFWESGRMLIHFNSDLDLNNPAVWENLELAVEIYNIDEQVVVSLAEVQGSNAYLTRDYVARVLFNCVILGERLELPPRKPEPPSQEAPSSADIQPE